MNSIHYKYVKYFYMYNFHRFYSKLSTRLMLCIYSPVKCLFCQWQTLNVTRSCSDFQRNSMIGTELLFYSLFVCCANHLKIIMHRLKSQWSSTWNARVGEIIAAWFNNILFEILVLIRGNIFHNWFSNQPMERIFSTNILFSSITNLNFISQNIWIINNKTSRYSCWKQKLENNKSRPHEFCINLKNYKFLQNY